MIQSSYYNCSLFNKTLEDNKSFSFIQEELLLKDTSNTNAFEKIQVEYICKYEEKIKLGLKPVAIIPIKDNTKLLEYTLNNLKTHKIFDILDFIIVDDRSTENIKTICDKYQVNYLRVDNQKGFNFSNLNNVAAKLAYDAGCDTIILWNSDLWVHDTDTIKSLLELHKQHNSTISGTKLLYPLESWDGDREVPENIKMHFMNRKDTYRGTVQFGGGLFIFTPQNNIYSPMHYRRFAIKDDPYVNCNKPDTFVTGAFQIINLKWFIDNGGMNPSLSKNFQDIDLCLRALEDKKTVYYFGKDLYLYHDESLSLSKDKFNKQFFSDNILYSKIWNIARFYKTAYSLE
jgi:hypothetical protein